MTLEAGNDFMMEILASTEISFETEMEVMKEEIDEGMEVVDVWEVEKLKKAL